MNGIAAAVLFALLALSCRAVPDAVVKPRALSASNCVSECAHAFADSTRAESEVHVANVHACADDSTCLTTEEVRHDAAVARIAAGREACKAGCHEQGGGSGGS